MAVILDGKATSAQVRGEIATAARALTERTGVVPGLAVVIVGDDPASQVYVRNKRRACEQVGFYSEGFELPADTTQETLEALVDRLNEDDRIHGILVQLPLPRHLDGDRALSLILPEKDVDGITDGSMAGVFTNMPIGYPPCTAQACLEILKHYNVPLSGKRAVVVGRSLVVGKPAAMMLDRENATVTLCNSRTRDLPALCREADVLVVAMGRRGAIGADCLREGQVVVDVGIHVNEEGKLCGDVRFDEAEPIVEAVTPVPGGVGTVTTSVLVGHVVDAASAQ